MKKGRKGEREGGERREGHLRLCILKESGTHTQHNQEGVQGIQTAEDLGRLCLCSTKTNEKEE